MCMKVITLPSLKWIFSNSHFFKDGQLLQWVYKECRQHEVVMFQYH